MNAIPGATAQMVLFEIVAVMIFCGGGANKQVKCVNWNFKRAHWLYCLDPRTFVAKFGRNHWHGLGQSFCRRTDSFRILLNLKRSKYV